MTDWPNLFVVSQCLSRSFCEEIVAEMRAVGGSAAPIYGTSTEGTIDQSVRRTLRVRPSPETIQLVTQQLWSCKEAVEKHFSVALTECEDPQFLRYREGDFFVAHQDGNTGLLRLDTERRLVSTVIFLSRESDALDPDTYSGGALVFSDLRYRFHMRAEPGTLVAFRSETTHEVNPVTRGERYSIASWYR